MTNPKAHNEKTWRRRWSDLKWALGKTKHTGRLASTRNIMGGRQPVWVIVIETPVGVLEISDIYEWSEDHERQGWIGFHVLWPDGTEWQESHPVTVGKKVSRFVKTGEK